MTVVYACGIGDDAAVYPLNLKQKKRKEYKVSEDVAVNGECSVRGKDRDGMMMMMMMMMMLLLLLKEKIVLVILSR